MTAADTGIQPSSRVARSDAIIFTEFDDAVVMMDAEVGRYYELNATGARIWTLVESAPRVAEVCQRLVAEYAVAADTGGDEVRAFMDKLYRLQIVRILPGGDLKGSDGNETHGGSLAHSTSGTAAAPPQRKEPGANLAWTTPDVRVMDTRSVATTATYTVTPKPETPSYDWFQES